MDIQQLGQRISIVGTTGSGKTTLAKAIAQQLQLPHVELDALHWEPNWVEAPNEVFRARVEAALKGDRWVVDGNYSEVRDILWGRADTVIWLDYPFWTVFGRLVGRSLHRSLTRQELWSGNRESFLNLFTSDSILLWMLKTYNKRRREYPVLLAKPEYQHLQVVRVRSPQFFKAV